MLGIRFRVKNPCRVTEFISYYIIGGYLFANKSWELQLSYYNYDLFSLELDFAGRGHDHAGIKLEVNIFGYTLTAQITDNRHWDSTNNCWSK